MNCQDFRNQMMDLVLGEITPLTRSVLEEHAHGCLECGPMLRRMMRTQDLLKQGWREEEAPTSIVFTPVVEPARGGIWPWLLGVPRWARATMAVAAVVLVLFSALSLARVEFRYDQGHVALSFGPRGSRDFTVRSAGSIPTANASFDVSRIEKLVSEKYVTLSAQDQAQYAAMLDRLAAQMNARREADLEKIGSAFEQVKTIVWKDMQRNNAIVQYAAQHLATQSKN